MSSGVSLQMGNYPIRWSLNVCNFRWTTGRTKIIRASLQHFNQQMPPRRNVGVQ